MRKNGTVLGCGLALATLISVGVVGAQPAKRGARTPDAEAVAPAAEGVVNINTATPEQLMLLPGIGPAKAQAIVEARRRQPFAAADQILRVRGIGRATLRRLRPYLSVRGETTLSQPARTTRSQSTAAPTKGR